MSAEGERAAMHDESEHAASGAGCADGSLSEGRAAGERTADGAHRGGSSWGLHHPRAMEDEGGHSTSQRGCSGVSPSKWGVPGDTHSGLVVVCGVGVLRVERDPDTCRFGLAL
jgi:hypothetical protein